MSPRIDARCLIGCRMVSTRQRERERGWRSVPATFPGSGLRLGHALMVSDGRVDTPTPPSTLPPTRTVGGRMKREGTEGGARFGPPWGSRRAEALKKLRRTYAGLYRSILFSSFIYMAGRLPAVCLLQESFRAAQTLISLQPDEEPCTVKKQNKTL